MNNDYVEFVSPCFYGLESDEIVKIKVHRIGCCASESSVELKLSYAGNHILSVLTFEEGDHEVEYPETIRKDGRWELKPIVELTLSNPVGASLGPLVNATINITNADTFPGRNSFTNSSVLRNFIALMIRLRGKKFYHTACALMYTGLLQVWESFSLKLVLDVSYDQNLDWETRTKRALFISCAYLFFFAVNNLADIVLVDKGGNCGIRKWLRCSLVLKYLNLSEHGREGLSDGDFVNDVVFTVEQVCDDCWLQVLLCIKFSTTFFASFGFQVWLLNGKVPVLFFLPILLVLPSLMTLLLYLREHWFARLIFDRQEAEDKWVDELMGLVNAKSLILGAGTSHKVLQAFNSTYEDFWKKHRKARFFQQRSEWIPRYALVTVFFAIYAAAPTLVDSYALTPGDCAALVKSWFSFRDGFDNIYSRTLLIQRSGVAIGKLADILNREERATARCGKRTSEGAITFLSLPAKRTVDTARFEEIRFERAKFNYLSTLTGYSKADVIRDVNLKVPCCGKLFAVSSGHGGGKKTLLKLLSGVVLPTDGIISAPPNKRPFLLERRVHLVNGSLLQNLRACIIDVGGEHDDVTDDMCWEVAKRAGLSEHLWKNYDFVVNGSIDTLCDRDAAVVALAQAFLAQPGLLCIDHLGDALGAQWTLGILLPLLRMYTRGGLTAVLKGSDEAINDEPLAFRPTVIWNTFHDVSREVDHVFVIEGGHLSLRTFNDVRRRSATKRHKDGALKLQSRK